MTRGLMLHNPANIRLGKPPFQNEILPSADKEFRQFNTPQDGIRAAAKILLTYFHKYHLDTIATIINRWAPPSENNTSAYVKNVCNNMMKGPDDALDLTDKDLMASLVEAITHQEQGCCPYDEATVNAGVLAAYS